MLYNSDAKVITIHQNGGVKIERREMRTRLCTCRRPK